MNEQETRKRLHLSGIYRRWFTSGSTAEFERLGAIFLGHPISAELHIHQENL